MGLVVNGCGGAPQGPEDSDQIGPVVHTIEDDQTWPWVAELRPGTL